MELQVIRLYVRGCLSKTGDKILGVWKREANGTVNLSVSLSQQDKSVFICIIKSGYLLDNEIYIYFFYGNLRKETWRRKKGGIRKVFGHLTIKSQVMHVTTEDLIVTKVWMFFAKNLRTFLLESWACFFFFF